MPVDKSSIKPATTWRLDRARQRILELQQQQRQQQQQNQHSEQQQQQQQKEQEEEEQQQQQNQNQQQQEQKQNQNSASESFRNDSVSNPVSPTASPQQSQWIPAQSEHHEYHQGENYHEDIAQERRPSAHSFTKLIPSNPVQPLTALTLALDETKLNERHNSTYTVYSDASDRFSFDVQKTEHQSPVSSASSSTNNNKSSEFRAEPILPRSSLPCSYLKNN